MLSRYNSLLRDSISERKAATAPSVLPVVSAVIAITICYIVLAIFLIPSGEPREYHFVNEHGAVTALSAIFLAASGTFSFATMTILRRNRDPYTWVWFVLAVGFAFLSFDELLQFHERLGRLIERINTPGVFRSWNDIIVIAYGLVALPIIVGILPGLIRSPKVMELFAIGFTFYVIHTVIDSVNEPATTISVISEESAKLMCGAFLLIGSHAGFANSIWKHTPER